MAHTTPLPPTAAVEAMVAVALLLFFAVATASRPTDRAISYPKFQYLNLNEATRTRKIHQQSSKTQYEDAYFSLNTGELELLNLNEGHLRKPLKVDLIHRDDLPAGLCSPPVNNTHRFLQRIRRDVERVAALTRRLTRPRAATAFEVGSGVVSGIDQGSGEYFVRIGVGSPPRAQYMVIDTGSDVVWVQCQPCSSCYEQSDPVFDPAESASFSTVACASEICGMVETTDCNSGRCRYEILYSDGSYTKGTLALETLTIGSTQIRDVAIGCGHINRGMFIGAAGLLGLGGSSLSLVGQLGGQTGGAFSYCLVSRGSGSSGYLIFGREALPVGAAWVDLVRNPQAPSFYYIRLSGLAVGGVRVPVSETVFELTGSGDGGVVLDTGTAVTRLPAEAYVAFRDTFLEQTGNLPRAPGVSIFDTCYDLSGFVTVRVPTVSFYFADGPELTLPAGSFLVPVDETRFCLAFAASGSSLSIIGNIQQEGIQISVDGANGFVGFGPNVC